MVRAKIALGCGLLTAMLVLAGVASANPIGILTGGGEAKGQAESSYYVDATGALSQANQVADAQDQLVEQWKGANDAYEETRENVFGVIDSVQAPAAPACACDDVLGALDQVGALEVAHADSITKAADLETGIVDAGMDVSAAGEARAWYEDLFHGAKDLFGGLTDLFVVDTNAADDAKEPVKDLLRSDDDVRDQVTEILSEQHELPTMDPKASGNLGAEHATSMTSNVLGSIQP